MKEKYFWFVVVFFYFLNIIIQKLHIYIAYNIKTDTQIKRKGKENSKNSYMYLFFLILFCFCYFYYIHSCNYNSNYLLVFFKESLKKFVQDKDRFDSKKKLIYSKLIKL